MKRSDLNEEDGKRYDQIIDQMMHEIEQIPPLKGIGNVLSHHYTSQRREIEKKYLPQLLEILNNAEARGNHGQE